MIVILDWVIRLGVLLGGYVCIVLVSLVILVVNDQIKTKKEKDVSHRA